MAHLDYFKLQFKNFFRDFKTQFFNEDEGVYGYSPTYFDVDGIVTSYDIDQDNFSLMNAQHIIANMAGFRKWTDLRKASPAELELAKLLFDNQDKIGIEDWKMYIARTGYENETYFEPEEQIEILKAVFINREGHVNPFGDFRLSGKNDIKRPLSHKKARNIEQDSKELVECLHCGEKFMRGSPKHAPGCDGQEWDLIPVKN